MPLQSANIPIVLTLEQWGGVNQSSSRSVIDDQEVWWSENLIPIAPGELRAMWGPSAPIFTAPAGTTILRIFFANIDTVNPLGFMFLSNGWVDQVNLNTGAVVGLGQIWEPIAPHYFADLKLWKPDTFGFTAGQPGGVVIGSPQGLYAWDGATLTSPGQTPPAWLSGGATTDAAGNPLVMPSGLPGIFALEVYKERLWVMGQSVISFSAPYNAADFSTASGGGSFPYFGDQLTVSYTDLAASAGFLYIFGDSCTQSVSYFQLTGAGTITNPLTSTFLFQNLNPQIGMRFFRPVGHWLEAFALWDGAGTFLLQGSQVSWMSQKLTNLFNSLDYSQFEPTITPATIFGQRWLLFNGVFTDVYGVSRSMMLCWNGQLWTIASQNLELTHIGSYEQSGVIFPYGTDGQALYALFHQPDPNLKKRLATKAYKGSAGSGPIYLTIKQWKRLYVEMKDNMSPPGPEGVYLVGMLSTADGGIPNGSEEVAFEIGPGDFGVRPFPTIGKGISAWLDLESYSPDFSIERITLAYEDVSLFGA